MRVPFVVLFAFGFLASAGSAAAQSLPLGKWTGSSAPPDEPEIELTFEATQTGDTINFVLHTPHRGSYRLNDVRVVDDTLMFWFRPGPRVVCILARSGGAYSGVCTAANGMMSTMKMTPPRQP